MFAGKSLKDPTMLLKDAGVKNGSKIMLIGRKVGYIKVEFNLILSL